jgi:hypothetical protein
MKKITLFLTFIIVGFCIQNIEAQKSEYLTKVIDKGQEQYILKFEDLKDTLSKRLETLNLDIIEINNKIASGLITKKEGSKLKLNKIGIFDYYASLERYKQNKIPQLEQEKEQVIEQEKGKLKFWVKRINERLEKQEISEHEADSLKKEEAKKHAKNIENRQAIIDNQIALVRRGVVNISNNSQGGSLAVHIGTERGEGTQIGLYVPSRDINVPKYDIKTSNDLLFAFGLNNALIDGQDFSDTPYRVGKSWFYELGWNWKTRLLQDSNFLRLKYGFSFQWNKYQLTDNLYFSSNGNDTNLEEFPIDLKKSKFRTTNLVFPLHFEFGPSRKLENKDRIRYINNKKFKFGIGGYAGFNIGSKQKLKYKENGETIKQKTKRDFNVNPFVYGVSSYIGIGDTSLYIKYDLSNTFKNNGIDQNNISIGLRFDMD